MNNCVFCKILSGEVSVQKLYEDDNFVIIRDISPIAPMHYLAIPTRHYAKLADMQEKDVVALGQIFETIAAQSRNLGLENGYRLVMNQGSDAGQTVFHLHIHILGGKEMTFTC